MSAANLDKLARRFADPGVDGYARPPADPAHRAEVSHATSCSPAEYQALVTTTHKQILARLDAWRAEDQRIEGIFADLKRRRAATTLAP
jgi:hypothetical protein